MSVLLCFLILLSTRRVIFPVELKSVRYKGVCTHIVVDDPNYEAATRADCDLFAVTQL